MKTQFSEVLSEILSHSEISKNEMIRLCNIDRSSFFKFLNGSRTPTQEQLNTILSKLQLSPDEERELKNAYAHTMKSDSQLICNDHISDFLWTLEGCEESGVIFPSLEKEISLNSGSIQGRDNVYRYLAFSVENEISKSDFSHNLYLFLPRKAKPFWRWLLALMRNKRGLEANINYLIELPSRKNSRSEAIEQLKYVLPGALLNAESNSVFYYYSDSTGFAEPGILYKYSLLLQDRMILLNSDMDRAIVIKDPQVCNDAGKKLLNYLNSAHLLVEKVPDKKIDKERFGEALFYYGNCLTYSRLMGKNSIWFSSVDNIENCMKYEGSKEDKSDGVMNRKIALIRNIKEKIGKRVFLIDNRYLPSMMDWTIILTSKDCLLIRNEKKKTCFLIKEIYFVQEFGAYFSDLLNSGYILNDSIVKVILGKYAPLNDGLPLPDATC